MRTRLTLLLLLMAAASLPAADVTVARSSSKAIQQRVLQLVNEARARGRKCGSEHFPPVGALRSSDPLRAAAKEHATDMARRGYFDHRAPDGSQPKDRVVRAGYEPRLTGENIAFGPESAEEVVAGWLDSPGHCENIMDGRFTVTGIWVATGARRGHHYWVQTLAAPR